MMAEIQTLSFTVLNCEARLEECLLQQRNSKLEVATFFCLMKGLTLEKKALSLWEKKPSLNESTVYISFQMQLHASPILS